jgi:hypothetical protein
MLNANLTHHAAKRMQQRGIPEQVLPLLLAFGKRAYDHRGACTIYLTKKGRERIAQQTGPAQFKHLESVLDVYAVVDVDDYVLTVGHRTQRINRH